MGGGVANKQYKNKGFTLAELLAVIVILGIIALIVFPAVNKSIKSSKEKTYEEQKNIILRSARNWGLENTDQLSETADTYVSIEDLKQGGYIENKTVMNPVTEEEMNGCIVIHYDETYSQYVYSYNETNCNELNTLPVIILTGESTITIGIGEIYNELGASASYQDVDVTSSIKITDNIDNSKAGTYQVRYNVTYNGVSAREVVRTIKVVDKSPVITLKGNSTITIGINETYTDEGATAKTYEGTDISSSIVVTNDVDTTKAGTYTVKYNVTHDGKSAKEVTRTVTVVDKNPVITLNQTGTTGYEQSVTIDVTVTPYKDNTISSIKYKLNGGSEQTVNNNQIVLNTSGEYNLEIIVTDSEGNITTLTSGPYYIDADKPTMTLEVSDDQINDSGWSKEDIIINVTPTDIGGSNIKEYLYCYGNDCTPSITGTGNTITISDEGENNYVCAVAIDSAGNESEKVCVGPYKIDKTIEEPTIESTTQANSNGWYKEDINLNITTGADASGINSIKYCKTSASTTCTPDTSISGTNGSITIDTESATNYVCAVSIDGAENESTAKCTGPYALDKTAPTLTVPEDVEIQLSEASGYNLLDGASASDELSQLDGSITTSGSLSAVVGDYAITYTVTDKAGNTVTKIRTIKVLNPQTFTEVMSSTSEVASLDPDGNLRYVGQNPSNYVEFNGELWRIIGVFDGQAKIIRDEYYNDGNGIAFDLGSSAGGTHGTYGYSDWNQATLKTELNGTYLTSIQTNDPISYSYIDLEHVWNIGGLQNYSSSTRSDFYNAERSETISSVMTSHLWTGAIGLMYPSDYGYSTSATDAECDTAMYNWDTSDSYATCYTNSWLYDSSKSQRTITPQRGSTDSSTYNVYCVHSEGHVNSYRHIIQAMLQPRFYI